MRLTCGEEFDLPGEAFAAMTGMTERERRGWDARFTNAASSEVARRLVDQLLALTGQSRTLTHVATTEGIWGEMFRQLFARAGVAQDDSINRVTIKCDERTHLESFHAWVYQQLLAALDGRDFEATKNSFLLALDRVRGRLQISEILR